MGRKKVSRGGKSFAAADCKQRIVALAQADRLQEAKALALRACHAGRGDAEAWFLLGSVHGGLQEFEPAAECFRRAIGLQPDAPIAHYNLGIALIRIGNYDGAITSLREAVRLSPEWPDAHHDLGNALLSAGMMEEAMGSYRRAISLKPEFAAAHLSLANALSGLGQFRAAIAGYEAAKRLDAGLLAAYHGLANALHAEGRLEEAADQYRSLLRIESQQVAAHVNLGSLLEESGDLSGAEASYRAALGVQPNSSEAMYNLGKLLQGQDKPGVAAEWYRKALEVQPDLAPAHNNLGIVLLEEDAIEAASRHFKRAIECDPAQIEAHRNLAKSLRELGQPDRALDVLNKLIARVPELAEAHWDRALLWLLSGDFERGWPEYEWRWEGEGLRRRRFPQPLWDGSDLHGRTVLIYAEQGVGDEVMFASCFGDVMAQAGQVVIDCDPRLAPLFSRSFPAAIVHGGPQTDENGWLDKVPHIDTQAAAGTSPGFLRPSLRGFPQHDGYLIPDRHLVEKWRDRYTSLGSGTKIGISWRGGHVSQARKRSTRLEQWEALIGVDDAVFVNLQYGSRAREIDEFRQRYGLAINDWSDVDPLRDLDDFAAQIAALDLVISVDNSTVHLAGALGVPAWVLQPFAPDWRWLLGVEDSYWYPSVRQFRQSVRGDWAGVLHAAREALVRSRHMNA